MENSLEDFPTIKRRLETTFWKEYTHRWDAFPDPYDLEQCEEFLKEKCCLHHVVKNTHYFFPVEAFFLLSQYTLVDDNALHWGFIAYEMLLLGYLSLTQAKKNFTSTLKPTFMEIQSFCAENVNRVVLCVDDPIEDTTEEVQLKVLELLCVYLRILLQLDGKQLNLVHELTLTTRQQLQYMGCAYHLDVLDVRYRIVLLIDLLQVVDRLQDSQDIVYARSWCDRQIHVLNVALTLGLGRLLRLHPDSSYRSRIKEQMGSCAVLELWYHKYTKPLPRFSTSLNTTVHGRANSLLRLFHSCFTSITFIKEEFHDIFATCDACYQIKITPVFQTHLLTSLLRLFRLMSRISLVNGGMTSTVTARKDEEISVLHVNPSQETPEMPQCFSTQTFAWKEHEKSDVGNVQRDASIEWRYESPFLITVIAYLWNCVAYESAQNGLNRLSRSLAYGVFLFTALFRGNTSPLLSKKDDVSYPTQCNNALVVPYGGFSMETHALLFLRSLWTLACRSDSLQVQNQRQPQEPPTLQKIKISSFVLQVISRVATVDLFVQWIRETMTTDDIRVENFHCEEPCGYKTQVDGQPPELKKTMLSNISARMENLLSEFLAKTRTYSTDGIERCNKGVATRDPPALDETICVTKPYHEERRFRYDNTTKDEGRRHDACLTPIQFIWADDMENIIAEVACGDALTFAVQQHIMAILCDYRRYLNAQALSIVLLAWHTLSRVHSDHPLGKCGSQTAVEGVCRFFLVQGTVHLINRIFQEVHGLQREETVVRNAEITVEPVNQNAWTNRNANWIQCIENVAIMYTQNVETVIEELKGDIRFYGNDWEAFVSQRNYLETLLNTSYKCLRKALQEYINSSFWCHESFIISGSSLVMAVCNFEAFITRTLGVVDLRLSYEDSLVSLFSSTVLESLDAVSLQVVMVARRCFARVDFRFMSRTQLCERIVDLFTFLHSMVALVVFMDVFYDAVIAFFTNVFDSIMDMFSAHLLRFYEQQDFLYLYGHLMTIFDGLLEQPDMKREHMDFKKYFKKVMKHLNKNKGKQRGYTKGRNWTSAHVMRQDLSASTPRVHSDDAPVSVGVECVSSAIDCEKSSYGGSNLSGDQKIAHMDTDQETCGLCTLTPKSLSHIARRFGVALASEYYNVCLLFTHTRLKQCLVHINVIHLFSHQFTQLTERMRQRVASEFKNRGSSVSCLDSVPVDSLTWNHASSQRQCTELTYSTGIARNNAFNDLVDMVASRSRNLARVVCRYTILRSLLVEFGEAFFLDLYNPTFSNFPLTSILEQYPVTIDRLISKVPKSLQSIMLQAVAEFTAKLWCFIVVQMSYNGKVLFEEDLRVIDKDTTALHDLLNKYMEESTMYSMSERLKRTAPSTLQSTRGFEREEEREMITLHDNLDDFVRLIRAQPTIFKRLYDEYKKTVKKSRFALRHQRLNSGSGRFNMCEEQISRNVPLGLVGNQGGIGESIQAKENGDVKKKKRFFKLF